MDIMEYTVDKFHIVDQKPVPISLASFFCLSRLTIFFFEKSCLTIFKITEITLIDPMT